MRAAVLTSARAPGLESLLERDAAGEGPYRIAGVVASDSGSSALPVARAAGVPTAVRDPEAFCRKRGTSTADGEARRAVDRELARELRGMGAESVIMCGYLWIATDALLDAFPDRVLNVHDADLTLRNGEGVPLYRGLRSTRDAVLAGERETRSTVHLATERVDVGPPLVLSRAFPVHSMVEEARAWGAEDLLKAYAYAQREWMMRASWGPLLDRALELLAEGRIQVPADGGVAVDGESAPIELDERTGRARRVETGSRRSTRRDAGSPAALAGRP